MSTGAALAAQWRHLLRRFDAARDHELRQTQIADLSTRLGLARDDKEEESDKEGDVYNFRYLSRRALAITDTELTDMAAAAIIGFNVMPSIGRSTPAAAGMASTL